jgi:hypothetical protein
MTKQKIKFKIQAHNDRQQIAGILAENGYNVKVEKKKKPVYDYDYFVVVELENE